MRRSLLFVPGNTPGLLMNSDILGADSVIFDLEDAISPTEKDAARILVRNMLRFLGCDGCEVIVRINPIDTEDGRRDLEEIVPLRPGAILPPKVGCAQDVRLLCEHIGRVETRCALPEGVTRLMPLIETSMGVENAMAIATADPRICALCLGGEDLTADLRCQRTRTGDEIFYSRTRLVMAAHAAGVEVYDTPFTDVDDLEGLAADARFARSLGFAGKLAISPRHVATINEVFSPSDSEMRYAHEVMEAIREAQQQGRGVVSLRGKMIDAPVVARARQVIEQEQSILGRREG
ncbi:MAG: CoA ester lyase [Oscillospiraceae bacterium]